MPEDLCDALALAPVIAVARVAPRPDYVPVVEAIRRRLCSGYGPPLGDLHVAVTVSPRQLQHISRRFFEVPPAQVLKRYRAIRAAMLLANSGLADELREDMVATYFDQAHLIRDIRCHTGCTTTQLRTRSLASGLLDPVGHGSIAAFLRTTDD